MKSRLSLSILIVLLILSPTAHWAVGTQTQGVPSSSGLVVSTSSLASDVGAAILNKGGNAVDAAIATAFALAVTHPSAGNIGGGGFMIVRQTTGESVAIDYRERAPLKATPEMYVDSEGNIDRSLIRSGYLGCGVPGTVRGLELAHRRYGSLPWKDLVMPAVRLAQEGFALSESLAASLNRQLAGTMGRFPTSAAAYGKPGGGQWAPGERIVLSDLGKSLRAIATEGPDVFYKGWISELIEKDMAANGGLITREDLAQYEPKVRQTVKGTFREYGIISMPPPSSGGTALIEMLNILENFDLRQYGRFSPETYHLMIEAMRRAFLDRARHLGDSDFVEVPVARLTSKEYAKELAATIEISKPSSSLDLGKDIVTVTESESEETTHFSVLDRNGMAVANTYTLESGYGSKVVIKGGGFLMNNEMGDFNKKPGLTNLRGDIGTKPNLIVPGKRMLSSMTPTMVTKNGKLVLITGSPGGRTIINTVLSIVLSVTEFGMNGRQAVDAARMHHQWLPNNIRIEKTIPAQVLIQLQEMGHDIRVQRGQGDGHTIFIDPDSGLAYGAKDKRSSDSKASRAYF